MSFSSKTRGRCWVATMHVKNFLNAELTEEQYKDPKFLAEFITYTWEESADGRTCAVVVCESKKDLYHAHVALYGNTTTLRNVSKILFNSHVEPQLGGKQALREYLLKEGYEEKEEKVLYAMGIDNIQESQGSRGDLVEVRNLILEGLTPGEIYDKDIRFRKFDKHIKAEYLAHRRKSTPTEKNMHVEYHVGETGSGKSYTYLSLCNELGEDHVFYCNDYNNFSTSAGGFDFYAENPAERIVLDEFRGQIPYATFLTMLDKYSRAQLHCRHANIYCLWTHVYIMSPLPPEEVYKKMVHYDDRDQDSFQQMMRRINIIVYHYIENGEYKTYSVPADKYISYSLLKKEALGKVETYTDTDIDEIFGNKSFKKKDKESDSIIKNSSEENKAENNTKTETIDILAEFY